MGLGGPSRSRGCRGGVSLALVSVGPEGKSQGWRWVEHVPELLVRLARGPAHLDFWSVVWVSAAHEH